MISSHRRLLLSEIDERRRPRRSQRPLGARHELHALHNATTTAAAAAAVANPRPSEACSEVEVVKLRGRRGEQFVLRAPGRAPAPAASLHPLCALIQPRFTHPGRVKVIVVLTVIVQIIVVLIVIAITEVYTVVLVVIVVAVVVASYNATAAVVPAHSSDSTGVVEPPSPLPPAPLPLWSTAIFATAKTKTETSHRCEGVGVRLACGKGVDACHLRQSHIGPRARRRVIRRHHRCYGRRRPIAAPVTAIVGSSSAECGVRFRRDPRLATVPDLERVGGFEVPHVQGPGQVAGCRLVALSQKAGRNDPVAVGLVHTQGRQTTRQRPQGPHHDGTAAVARQEGRLGCVGHHHAHPAVCRGISPPPRQPPPPPPYPRAPPSPIPDPSVPRRPPLPLPPFSWRVR